MKIQGARAKQLQEKRKQLNRPTYKVSLSDKKKSFAPKFLKPEKSKNKSKDKKKKEAPKTLKGKVFFWAKRVAIAFGIFLVVGILAGSITMAVLISKYSKDLPEFGDKIFDQVKTQGVSIITDRNGKELYRMTGDRVYDYLKIQELNKYFKWSIIAVENPSYYEDSGVSVEGILRAVYTTYVKKEAKVGGSTITQQVIKNLVLSEADKSNRTPEAKIKEAVLAMQITSKYTKDQILELYINSAPMGREYYGVKKGAEVYFGKSQDQLTLAEAAFLAGLPNAPTAYSPFTNPDPVKDDEGNDVLLGILRQRRVLKDLEKMVGKPGVDITKEEIDAALKEQLNFKLLQIDKKAPWFVDYVVKQLDNDPAFKDKGGIEYIKSANLTIKTSLDLDMQDVAQTSAKKIREAGLGAQNVGLVTLDVKTGEVLVMVGSRDFYDTVDANNPKFDRQQNLTTSYLSPGSSIKPFNYLNLFQKGYGPSSVLSNIKLNFGGYSPNNYFASQVGNVSQTIGPNDQSGALFSSLNIPAVQAILAQGVDNFAEFMQKMGYDDYEVEQIRAGATSTLGSAVIQPLHQAHAFATIANGGVKTPIVAILEIKDTNNNVVYTPDRTETRVIEEKFTWLITDLIKNHPGASPVAANGWRNLVAGKSGTNDFCTKPGQLGNPTAVSFYGYTKQIVTGSIAVNSNNDCLLPGADGGTLGKNIWSEYMNNILPRYADKKQEFVRPAGVVSRQICKDTGLLHVEGDNCDKIPNNVVSALFADGAFPPVDKNHKVAQIATCADGSEKLANPAQIAAGQAKEKVYARIPAAYAPIQPQIDAFTKFTEPPKETCSGFSSETGDVFVQINTPAAGDVVKQGSTMSVTGTASGTAEVIKVEAFLDGTSIGTGTASPYTINYNMTTSTPIGNHVLKVVATDKDGKIGSKSITIMVATSTGVTPTPVTGTSVTLTSPISDIPAGVQQIKATVNDPSNLITAVNFEIQKDSGPIISVPSVQSGPSYATNYAFTGPAGSKYTIKAIATLSGGGTVSSSTVTITIL